MLDGLEHIRAIAWDFDGVLNRNIVDGAFPWQAVLAEEFDIDIVAFTQVMFRDNPRALFCGDEDVLDRLARWAGHVGFDGDVEEVLLRWFEEDLVLDEAMLRLMAQIDGSGITQVLATNNEQRRMRFVLQQSAVGDRIDGVFASGEIGTMKPEPAFFELIETGLGMNPSEILLIDDAGANVEAAEKRGWLGWHYDPGEQMALAQALMPLMLGAE